MYPWNHFETQKFSFNSEIMTQAWRIEWRHVSKCIRKQMISKFACQREGARVLTRQSFLVSSALFLPWLVDGI